MDKEFVLLDKYVSSVNNLISNVSEDIKLNNGIISSDTEDALIDLVTAAKAVAHLLNAFDDKRRQN